jgi:peptide/nickel transport system permease protein
MTVLPSDDALDATPPRRGFAVLATLRRYPLACAGGFVLLLLALAALLAPWLWTVDPQIVSPARRLRPPSAQYWFGTDQLGRDVYSRVIYGSRVSIIVGFGVAIIATAIGLLIGLLTGFNRIADAILSRVMDGLMAIPSVLLAIALMALTRASVEGVIAAITVAEIPRIARLVRSVVLSLREQPFIEAARAIGTTRVKILWRHILPNTAGPLMVQASYICASAILIEATLSFLGAGAPAEIPSWGNIMAEGRALFQIAPSIIFFPAVFLSLAVLSVNLLGDGLRDALDPRLSRRL